jgi:hypothetical protein
MGSDSSLTTLPVECLSIIHSLCDADSTHALASTSKNAFSTAVQCAELISFVAQNEGAVLQLPTLLAVPSPSPIQHLHLDLRTFGLAGAEQLPNLQVLANQQIRTLHVKVRSL